jgi:DNA processing protein
MSTQNDKIRKISLKDGNYPPLLKKIKNPPKNLYIKGDPISFTKQPCFAVVGTRKISQAGYALGFKIARDLARAGLTIVSGLAEGGDTAAHRGALECNYAPVHRNKKPALTIAVMGTSLEDDLIFPKENFGLSKQILASGGALISEYQKNQPGSKWTFPERNRIIAGLSLGVLVLECPEKSGALITAREAQRAGRLLFAVPSSPYQKFAQGPNFLIRDFGAYLTLTSQDIIKILTQKLNLQLTTANKQQKSKLLKDKNQAKVFEILQQGPVHIDELCSKTGFNAPELSQILTEMELEDLIKEVGPKIYAIA